MAEISLRALSDEKLKEYEALEASGGLSEKQAQALADHRLLPDFVDAMVERMRRREREEEERREFLRDSKFLPIDNRWYFNRVYDFEGTTFDEVVNYMRTRTLVQESAIVVEDKEGRFHVWYTSGLRHDPNNAASVMYAARYLLRRSENAFRAAVLWWVYVDTDNDGQRDGGSVAVVASKNYSG